jgi:crotonobetainyl-CoA:carnitine CoA-transferase CaiB-like acyl-CoA transferase
MGSLARVAYHNHPIRAPVRTHLLNLRVLELGPSLATAYCTKLLADWGAAVTLAAPRDGADSGGSEARAALRAFLDARKRRVALDIEAPEGAAHLRALVAAADVVVESSPPGALEALGCGYRDCARAPERARAGLTWLAISSFGQTGPAAQRPAEELTIWACAGLLWGTGRPDREPVVIGREVVEFLTGAYGAAAVLQSVYQLQGDGSSGGHYIDLSRLEAAIWLVDRGPHDHAYFGPKPRAAPRYGTGILPCRDGFITLAIPSQEVWQTLCAVMERPDLRDDPRFATPTARQENFAEALAAIAAWAAGQSKAEVFALAAELRLPFAYIATTADVLDSPQHAARGFFRALALADGREIRAPDVPFRIAEGEGGT